MTQARLLNELNMPTYHMKHIIVCKYSLFNIQVFLINMPGNETKSKAGILRQVRVAAWWPLTKDGREVFKPFHMVRSQTCGKQNFIYKIPNYFLSNIR